jgi:hypothetical protein
MVKTDSRKAGLVYFCGDKAPFSGKKSSVTSKSRN